jgi:hypothetical protein
MHDLFPSNLGQHGNMVFDGVLLNEGNAYNPSTGIFTCSNAGTYVFSWTYIVSPGSFLHTQLMVNHAPYVSSLADAQGHSTGVETGTHTAVAHLNSGDVAYIRAASTGHGQVYWGLHDQSHGYCTFSGWLLH